MLHQNLMRTISPVARVHAVDNVSNSPAPQDRHNSETLEICTRHIGQHTGQHTTVPPPAQNVEMCAARQPSQKMLKRAHALLTHNRAALHPHPPAPPFAYAHSLAHTLAPPLNGRAKTISPPVAVCVYHSCLTECVKFPVPISFSGGGCGQVRRQDGELRYAREAGAAGFEPGRPRDGSR